MDFSIFGVCFDKTQTLRVGAAKGPDSIRKSFSKLETFVNGVDLTEHFINDLGNVYSKSLDELKIGVLSKMSEVRGFPIILGGEHTVTSAVASALSGGVKPVNLVVFDAHPDCEEGDKHNGAIRAAVNILGIKNVYFCGLRSYSLKEKEFMDSRKFKIVDIAHLKKVKGPTYVTVDFDVLDPAIMPAVGNPEPDGMSVGDVVEGVRNLKDVVAVDFVEFTPTVCAENEIHSIIAGKLIYSIMAEIVKKNLFP